MTTFKDIMRQMVKTLLTLVRSINISPVLMCADVVFPKSIHNPPNEIWVLGVFVLFKPCLKLTYKRNFWSCWSLYWSWHFIYRSCRLNLTYMRNFWSCWRQYWSWHFIYRSCRLNLWDNNLWSDNLWADNLWSDNLWYDSSINCMTSRSLNRCHLNSSTPRLPSSNLYRSIVQSVLCPCIATTGLPTSRTNITKLCFAQTPNQKIKSSCHVGAIILRYMVAAVT